MDSQLGFTLSYTSDGVKDRWILPGLVFADDVVLMAETNADLQALINICTDAMTPLGLNFNAKKSAVLCFSAPSDADRPVRIPNGEIIARDTEYRYLGIRFSTQPDYTTAHEDHLKQASRRAGSILRRRCLWGCNRFIMVRELWKAVHVPALTFANAVVCLTSSTREWLERGQRAVGRLAPGCHGRVANEAVQGDLGWSTFEAREARSKIAYDGRLRFMHKDRWARKVFDYVSQNFLRTKWIKRLQHLRRKFGFLSNEIQADSAKKWAKAVDSQVREREREAWRAAMDSKPTLEVYRANKRDIRVESLYDNSVGSRLLFEARAGAIPTLSYRKRFDPAVESTMCRACGAGEETTEHIVQCCESLPTPPQVGATFPQALGFSSPCSPNGDDRDGTTSGTSAANEIAARVTKRRLTEWWTIVRR